jgi:DNA-binding MarR family transcriptional regulator
MTSSADRASRVVQLTGRLIRRMRAQAEDGRGLSITQDWVIALLLETPMSAAELARAQGVRAQTMSATVQGLEEVGYIRREADPADGRRIVLHATDAAAEAHEVTRERKHRWLQDALAEVDPDDLRALDRGLDVLERIAES